MSRLLTNEENNTRLRLVTIRDRYFRPVIKYPEGHLNHHGDCETFRAMEVYKYAPCTCGLLHDLRMLPGSIVSKIYPKRNEDYSRQEAMVPGSFYWMTLEEKARHHKEAKEFIKEHFGEPQKLSLVEWEQQTESDWNIIRDVFGEEFCERMRAEWIDYEI